MKFTTLTRRTAAAGAASALVAAGLVGMTSTAAQAAPINNEYFCDGPTADFPLFLDSDVPALATIDEISAGFSVPAGLMDVVNDVTVPTPVIDGLGGSGITRVESNDFIGTFGPRNVKVNGVGAEIADAVDNPDNTSTLSANGANAPFEVPAAGSYDLVSPESMTLDALNAQGDLILQATCTLAEGETAGTYGTLQVVKNDSTSKATPTKKSFRKGTAASVKVKVTAPNETPGGKVLLKKGQKTLTKGNLNKKGIVVLKTKKLKVGKNKLTTVYKGDGYTNGSKDAVTVTVKR